MEVAYNRCLVFWQAEKNCRVYFMAARGFSGQEKSRDMTGADKSKERLRSSRSLEKLLLLVLLITVPAINGAVIRGTERNLSFDAAFSAANIEHFPFTTRTVSLTLTGAATFRAAGGVVLEAFFRVEVLFRRRKEEFRTAVFACQSPVLESHVVVLLLWFS